MKEDRFSEHSHFLITCSDNKTIVCLFVQKYFGPVNRSGYEDYDLFCEGI